MVVVDGLKRYMIFRQGMERRRKKGTGEDISKLFVIGKGGGREGGEGREKGITWGPAERSRKEVQKSESSS